MSLMSWRKAAAFKRWHEPYESRGSRTELWGTGGEIPPVYPAVLREPAVTTATKRTQQLHGVSIEPRNKQVAGAEIVEVVESNMSGAVMRGAVALPGSKNTSRGAARLAAVPMGESPINRGVQSLL